MRKNLRATSITVVPLLLRDLRIQKSGFGLFFKMEVES